MPIKKETFDRSIRYQNVHICISLDDINHMKQGHRLTAKLADDFEIVIKDKSLDKEFVLVNGELVQLINKVI